MKFVLVPGQQYGDVGPGGVWLVEEVRKMAKMIRGLSIGEFLFRVILVIGAICAAVPLMSLLLPQESDQPRQNEELCGSDKAANSALTKCKEENQFQEDQIEKLRTIRDEYFAEMAKPKPACSCRENVDSFPDQVQRGKAGVAAELMQRTFGMHP